MPELKSRFSVRFACSTRHTLPKDPRPQQHGIDNAEACSAVLYSLRLQSGEYLGLPGSAL